MIKTWNSVFTTQNQMSSLLNSNTNSTYSNTYEIEEIFTTHYKKKSHLFRLTGKNTENKAKQNSKTYTCTLSPRLRDRKERINKQITLGYFYF